MIVFRNLAFCSSKCPACSSKQIRFSHRRTRLEHIVSPVLRPIRCEDCGQRSFRLFPRPVSQPPSAHTKLDAHETPPNYQRSHAE